MKLSIIIPVYNTEEYIRQCIDSVMNIKNIETEIIAVNDGSTDRTKDILEEYTENHDRIKVITQENQGASAARNTGIKASTGDYIYFLDSDDWVDTVSFEKIIRQLEDDYKSGEKTDIVVGKEKAYSEFTKEEVLDERIPRELIGKIVSGKEYMIKSIKEKFWNVRLPIYLYSRKLLIDNGIYFPTGRRSNEDEVFSINVFYHAKKLKITDEIFGYYRARSGSIMSVLNITHVEDIFENVKKIVKKADNLNQNKNITKNININEEKNKNFQNLSERPKLSISKEELNRVAKRIFQNEAAGKKNDLVVWNSGENFPSLGIGHFIWYKKNEKGKFEESFPPLVEFYKSKNIELPKIIKDNKFAPWKSREEFLKLKQNNDPEITELINFLYSTQDTQIEFIFNRLEDSLEKMLKVAKNKEKLTKQEQESFKIFIKKIASLP